MAFEITDEIHQKGIYVIGKSYPVVRNGVDGEEEVGVGMSGGGEKEVSISTFQRCVFSLPHFPTTREPKICVQQ